MAELDAFIVILFVQRAIEAKDLNLYSMSFEEWKYHFEKKLSQKKDSKTQKDLDENTRST